MDVRPGAGSGAGPHRRQVPGPVTFFAGADGSGKSTPVEAIAGADGVDSRGGHVGRRYASSPEPGP